MKTERVKPKAMQRKSSCIVQYQGGGSLAGITNYTLVVQR